MGTGRQHARSGHSYGPLAAALVMALWGLPAHGYTVVGHWQYDSSGSQSVTDQSGLGNHMTLGSAAGVDANDPAYSTDDPQVAAGNHSLDFDGGNDYCRRTDTPSLNPATEFTLATWVKLDSLDLGDQDVLISNIEAFGASGGYQLLFAGGANPSLVVMYRDGSYTDRGLGHSVSGWDTDTWYHVAGTYDDQSGGTGELKLYIDGQLKASNGSVPGQIVYDNTPNFFLGTNYDGDGGGNTFDRELNGHLDETYVIADELTDSEVRELAEVDQRWVKVGSGNGSVKANWEMAKIPTYNSNVTLPTQGSAYTVTVDFGPWEINGLTIESGATADLAGQTLTVNKKATVNAGAELNVGSGAYHGDLGLFGTLRLAGGDVHDDVDTNGGCHIIGHGTLHENLDLDGGELRAQGGQLQLKKALTTHAGSVLNVESGATLDVPNNAWTNLGTLTLYGGSITGQTLTQQGTLSTSAGSGTSIIENVTFHASGNNTINAGSTLRITGTGAINGIVLPGTGTLQVADGGSVGGYGNVFPNVVVDDGTLDANTHLGPLVLWGNLTVNAAGQALGTGGQDLYVKGLTTINGGSVVGSSATAIRLEGGTVNGGTLRANGAVVHVHNSLTVEPGARAYASSLSTLNIVAGTNVHNRGAIDADFGTVIVAGTVKSNAANTGDFSATAATMIVTGLVETDCYNTFTAKAGGTIDFDTDLSTGTFVDGADALRLLGGTINLNVGRTLTVEAGHILRGQGKLLDEGRFLINRGTIEADGGTLRVRGGITNSGVMRPSAGSTLRVGSTLLVEIGGEVSATGTGQVDLQSPLTNNGTVSSRAGGAITLGTVVNDGLIEIRNGGGTAQMSVGSASGGGIYEIEDGTMVFSGLTLGATAELHDMNSAASVDVLGDLTNQSQATAGFDADQLTLRIYSRLGAIGVPHNVTWQAQDKGRSLAGLDDNLAVGTLVFGDGLGGAASDTFTLSADTILYCYGLEILGDADVDLNGATIYYLRDGTPYNGITGAGFTDDGTWHGGDILEIPAAGAPIPEPAGLALAAVALAARRRRR